MIFRTLSTLLFVGFSVVLSAKTVTVSKNSADNADFSKIQDAINSFGQIKDLNGTPNLVQILDDSAYEEQFTVNVHCSIMGTGANRPRLLVMTNTSANSVTTPGTSSSYDGLSINIPATVATTGTVLLKNLIIIPSRNQTPPDDGIVTTTSNAFIHFDNLLVTSNDGNDQPLSIDGLTKTTVPGSVPFGDDGICVGLEKAANIGEGHEFLMTNCVVTHLKYGLEADGKYRGKFVIGEGNVFSYNTLSAVEAFGDVSFISPIKRTLFMGNTGYSTLFFGHYYGMNPEFTRIIDGVIIFKNAGDGLHINHSANRPIIIKRSILAENTENLLIRDTNNNGDILIDRVTVAKPTGSSTVRNAGNNANILALNCIFTGNGSNSSIAHSSSGVLSLQNSAIVTNGPFSLNTPPFTMPGTVSGTAISNADPQFVQTNNPTAAAFYDVASPTFSNLNSFGTALVGGGKYAGATSSVADWNVY